MWFFLSVALAVPFHGADKVVFTDAVNLRATPSTSAEVVATLPQGTDVDVVETGEVLALWGRSEPWVRVTAGSQQGWLWSGLLSDKFVAIGEEGDGVVVGLRGLVKESEYSVRVSVEVGARVEGKVLEPARADLSIPTEWTADGVPFHLTVVSNAGLPGAEPVARLYFSADYCGGLSGNMVWARHEGKMVHVATHYEGSDAPVFANDGLVFPGEEGGKAGVVLRIEQVGEHNDDGTETYEVDRTTEHRWVQGKLVPPIETR